MWLIIGASVKVDGLLNVTGGQYEVLLSSDSNNSAERFELSSFSPFLTNTTLFYATGLDPERKYNLTITNTGNNTLAFSDTQVSVVSGGVPYVLSPHVMIYHSQTRLALDGEFQKRTSLHHPAESGTARSRQMGLCHDLLSDRFTS